MIDNTLYSKAYKLVCDDGDFFTVRDTPVFVPTNGDKYHIVTEDEKLTDIAHRFYGDSRLWYKIADVPQNNIFNPFVLTIGQILLLPNPNISKDEQDFNY